MPTQNLQVPKRGREAASPVDQGIQSDVISCPETLGCLKLPSSGEQAKEFVWGL